jgi:hypothetical protein
MVLKTNKEKQREVKNPVVVKNKEIEKQEILNEEVEKNYWLRHPDFPIVSEGKYSLDDKVLDIKEGFVITNDTEIKNKLVSQGFYYLGYKIEEQAYF